MFAKAAITGTLQAGTTTFTAEYLVVAGGGGGGSIFGGGGAGGYRSSVTGESSGGGASAESALSIVLGTPYAVTVGAGAASTGVALNTKGSNGNNSTFASIISIGGGGGGAASGESGEAGGSGGGGSDHLGQGNPGGAGTAGQGYAGGAGAGIDAGGGGGGGASAVGADGSANGGNGGDGVASSITGSSVARAGGGGGGAYTGTYGGTGGSGGAGGGGDAGQPGSGQAGTANTGGGGGGGTRAVSPYVAGGAGGSGVVIIRVPSTVVAEFSAGVVYNYIPLDDFNVYEITAAGASDTVTFSQGEVTTVGESLRFNDDDNAYLTRTPASAGDRKTWTWSSWVKRANISTGSQALLGYYGSSTNNHAIYFLASDALYFKLEIGGTNYIVTTTSVFRDSSSWYHIVCAFDSTQAVSSDRVKFFVNGVLQPVTITLAPPLNVDGYINSTVAQYIGDLVGDSLDGYLSDVYFIDGEALDPSRFGKQDADGIWQPISYTGSYGTNGFHLDFADNSTAAALGTDVSGNGNDWTPSGITTDDQVSDTPSVNWATLNLLDKGSTISLADGNLNLNSSGAAWNSVKGSIGVSSGKFYWEINVNTALSSNPQVMLGIGNLSASISGFAGSSSNVALYDSFTGNKFPANTSYGSTYSLNDVIGVALDMDAGTLTFYKNNTSLGQSHSGLTGTWFPFAMVYGTALLSTNFGQRPFAYTPPTGFQALNSANLPAPTITDGKAHFQPVLYTGNGTSQTVRGLEFQPDLVWLKERNSAVAHFVYDSVRGATRGIHTNLTDADTVYSDGLTAFLSNGFTIGSRNNNNGSGDTYVAWTWNAGGSTVTNTDGSITSQVRANTDAGISIVSYVGNGTDNATVGHGLGVAPGLIINKNRDTTSNWTTWHGTFAANDYIALNLTSAKNYAGALTNVFGGTDGSAPSSTVVKFGTDLGVNGSGQDIILYCFAEVDGFSKFGSYTGNGSADGPFVYTGFRPAFVMVKRTDSTGNWYIMDTARDTFNVVDDYLLPNASLAEGVYTFADFLSNGFKVRDSSVDWNASGGTYIFMAFAENPFKTSRAR